MQSSASSTSRNKSHAPAGLPAREAAFALLERVLGRGRTLEEAVADEAALLSPLDGRDRAFALLLARTVLRRLGQLDLLVDRYLERDPGGAKGRALRTLLRVGLAQLVFLGTPPHAAVDATVRLASRRKLGAFKGLVNAVLRRAAGDAGAAARDQDAARVNCPAWLWQSWTAFYGEPAARATAEMLLVEPGLDLSLKPSADASTLMQAFDAQRIGPETVRLRDAGDVTQLPGYGAGDWWVQDLAATMPVLLFGDVSDLAVADLCAAPGGKTAQLAAAGAKVTAIDRSENRVKRLRENMDRLGLGVIVAVADATDWTPDRPFDAVLIDAPCSGTGTIRRHPDLARLKAPRDVNRLSVLQDRLIDAGLDMLKPGGLLVFATCSLQPEEGEHRIEAVLDRREDVALVLAAGRLPAPFDEAIAGPGWVRAMPHHRAEIGGMDGFFAALLRRT